MKKYFLPLTISVVVSWAFHSGHAQTTVIKPSAQLNQVQHAVITDAFWSPKLKQWATITATDVLDKFEGKKLEATSEKQQHDVFGNFDKVAAGKKGEGHHAGLPWFDGLIYETIRGVGDMLVQYPDVKLQARLDGYIDRIYAAQQADSNGYINTYTELMEPTHRWGDNGGFLRWQHDVYNSGMLIEAGVHYYRATGKTKLLEVATRLANYMAGLMGPMPKRNIVPAHSGPEEAMIKLYWLYKNEPGLKATMNLPVNAQAYLDLAKFWIETRGHNVGFPLWANWGNDKSEKWIKEQQYKTVDSTAASRPNWGDYAQDSIPVLQQQTIEGHAVRATLLATGVTAMALENHDPRYIQAASRLWDNMTGRRMFITGGVGAIHNDEKFGADYFLPTDAYLETCAAVGAGFFSQRMNELTGDGKYMDEFERVLYNNVLTGISLSGTKYTYQNPLNAHAHSRWDWHSCPCCPPMFLKIVSVLPDYIYAAAGDRLYVNLYIGSNTAIKLANNNEVAIRQETTYPLSGTSTFSIDPTTAGKFSLLLRIPGWARGKENPYDLYESNLQPKFSITVNGKPVKAVMENGYAVIDRYWKKSDKVTLELPIQPRFITANKQAKDLNNLVAIGSGPMIYCLEQVDNNALDSLEIDTFKPMTLQSRKDLLNGINVVEGKAIQKNGTAIKFEAIPYYATGNREGKGYKVWLPVHGTSK